MARKRTDGRPDDSDQAAAHPGPVAGESNARAVRHPAPPAKGVAVTQLPQRDRKEAAGASDPSADTGAAPKDDAGAAAPTGETGETASTSTADPTKKARKRKVGKHKA